MITGQVLAADTGRPVSRARILLTPEATSTAGPVASADSGSELRATMTDSNGNYVFTGLAEGSYSLMASKTGYVQIEYKATRPQRPGKRIALATGQELRGVDIRLPRGSILTGRVFDENGDPVTGASVQAWRYQYMQGERRAFPAGGGSTDDRGQYRMFGLAPGTYTVSATNRGDQGRSSNDRSPDPSLAFSYAPVYYPGVPSPADAAPVVLGLQQEVSNIDFSLQLVPTARVSGTVVGDTAGNMGGTVMLVPDDPRGMSWMGGGMMVSGQVQRDGTFRIDGVPPGRYLLTARGGFPGGPGRGGGRGGATPLTGQVPLAVAGQDVTGVMVTLGTGGTLSGTVVIETGSTSRENLSQLRVTTRPVTMQPFGGSSDGGVQSDGSFTVTNVSAGQNLVVLQGVRSPWAVKGIFLNGRDISESPVEVRNGQALAGVQVLITDHPSQISGTVLDADEKPFSHGYVVAFPSDATLWQPLTRGIQGVRPDASGNYKITNLPAGSYLVVAVTDVDNGGWYDPALLESWRAAATPVTITEGEKKTVGMKVSEPQ